MDLALHIDDVIAAASLVLFDLIAARNSIVAAIVAVFDPRNFAASDARDVDVFALNLRFHPRNKFAKFI